MIDAVEQQLLALREQYPSATLRVNPDGGHIVHVPDMALPPGWSLPSTDVWAVAPAGYPTVRPDCFFADPDLRLASGGEPASSGQQSLDGIARRWFSWHLSTWDPDHDGLLQYVRFCGRRLAEAR